MRCFYSPEYYTPLPEGHPFPMGKFPEAAEMLLETGIIDPALLVEVGTTRRELLELVHDPRYLRRLAGGTLEPEEESRLGLPSSVAIFKRSSTEVEGTRRACRAALEDGIACTLAGGTHHAFPGHGEGFCALNDVAVAVRDLQRKHSNYRILVVDTDAHQGNGNHSIFASDKDVFTYSIHVGANYPSRKVPGDLDVPLPRYVPGDDYLEALKTSLPQALEARAKPDLAIWISGADPHQNDRFGQMMLSLKHLIARDEFVLDTLRSRDIPVAVLYGGGYNREPLATAKIHAQSISIAKKFAG